MWKADALQHEQSQRERSMLAINKIVALLSENQILCSTRNCWGDDVVDEILTILSHWMVERSATIKLLKILRQLEEDILANDLDLKKWHGKT